jgi:alpha-ribazole phosphatase
VKLVLLRHPPVDAPDGMCYGSSDRRLAPGWEGWVENVRDLLRGIRGQISVASSPLARCRVPARGLGEELIVDERLREMDFGEWEGKPWHQIPRREIDRWQADLVNAAPPGGESLAVVNARAESFLEHARSANVDALVAVTHAGPIRCMLALALAMPLQHLFRLRVDPGSVSVVTLSNDPPIVELVNLTLRGNAPFPPQTLH